MTRNDSNKCVLAAAMLVKKWQDEHGTDKARLEFRGDSPHVREFVGYDVLWTIAEDSKGMVWASTAIDIIRIDTLIDPLGDVDIVQETSR